MFSMELVSAEIDTKMGHERTLKNTHPLRLSTATVLESDGLGPEREIIGVLPTGCSSQRRDREARPAIARWFATADTD